jgi:hypothetical protein
MGDDDDDDAVHPTKTLGRSDSWSCGWTCNPVPVSKVIVASHSDSGYIQTTSDDRPQVTQRPVFSTLHQRVFLHPQKVVYVQPRLEDRETTPI